MLNNKEFQILLSNIDRTPETIIFVGLGEPLLNRHLLMFIQDLKIKGINSIIVSNLTVPKQTLIEHITNNSVIEIAVSIESTNRKRLMKFRPGINPKLFFDNINYLVNLVNRPKLSFNTIVTPNSLNDFESVLEFALMNRIDLVRWTIPHKNDGFRAQYKRTNLQEFLTQKLDKIEFWRKNKEIEFRYKQKGLKIKEHEKVCKAPWEAPLIKANGDVLLCCLLEDDRSAVVGNLYHNSFIDIWNSNRADYIRQKILNKSLLGCMGCEKKIPKKKCS